MEFDPRRIAHVADESELSARRNASADLLAVARPHLRWLARAHLAVDACAYLLDRDGVILWTTGPAHDAPEAIWSVVPVELGEEPVGSIGLVTYIEEGMDERMLSIEQAAFSIGRELDARAGGDDIRFKSAFDQSAIAASITRPDGRLIRVNRAFAELVGYSKRELRGRAFQSLTHPEDLPQNLELLDRALAGEIQHYAMEKRLVHASGQTVWVWLTVSLIRGDDGAPLHLVTQYQDLTERKRAEDRLRESEQRLEHIAMNVPGMVYQFAFRPDGHRGYTFVSEGTRRLFGVAPEDAIRDASKLLDLIHPDDRPVFRAKALELAEKLGELRWEGRAILPSGDERLIQVAARNRRQDDGVVLSDGVITDVTELRDAARRLEESQERYRSLFAHNPNAVFSFDCSGHFQSANPACYTLSGYSPGELVGTHFEPLLIPEDRAVAFGYFQTALEGTPAQYEITIRHKSGRRVRLAVTNVPIVVGGSIVGVFGIARDLTVQHELEQQLRQAQKMEAVGRLAGGVAHDFNNLLTVITSYTQMALAAVPPGSLQQDLREVETAAGRAAALTKQLLAFSRQQVMKPRVVDANQTVTDVAAMLGRLIGEDVALQIALAPDLWPVHSDPGQLAQVLMNLAVNARDAMHGGGTLWLRTANRVIDATTCDDHPGLVPGEYASLVVEDTGIGIDPAVLPQIFEPFFTTKALGQGTGLGLATVYGIVKQSGGFVYAESRLGKGSVFTVLLPRTRAGEASPTRGASPAAPGGTETILLVEDEAAVRAAVRRMLEALGYTVLEAANGPVALEIARQARAHALPVSMVLTDVVMPELSGRALGEQLAGAAPDMKILYMSGYTDDEILRRGLAQSGIALLEKPFTMDRLAEAVRGLLDRPRGDAAGEQSA